MLVELDLDGVRLEMPASMPVLMLRESGGQRRILPIHIGGPEASSIHYAIEGLTPERPLTHDLFVLLIESLNGELENIVITEVVEHTYFAELHVRTPGGERVISCRPSDAVAIAIRAGAPMFASSTLMDMVAKEEVSASGEDQEEILDDFRDFINSINPEDFQG